MSKKIMLLTALLVIVLAVGLVVWQMQDSDDEPQTLAQVSSKSTSSKPTCVKQDATSLNIDSKNKSSLETVITSKITDVPAGTTVDIHFSSYDGKTAKGSSIYPDKYGHYNFTAAQTGKPQGITDMSGNDLTGGWKITEFKSCQS